MSFREPAATSPNGAEINASSNKPARRIRVFSTIETIGLGLAILATICSVGYFSYQDARQLREQEFRRTAQHLSVQVARRLAEGETLTSALRSLNDDLYNASDAQFPEIVQDFASSHPHVKWVGFAERILAGRERAFEERVQAEGFMGLRIHPLPGSSGHISSGASRLPIYRLEPLSPNHARLLGADIMTHPDWSKSANAAVETGHIRAALFDESKLRMHGLVMMRPVYRGNVEPRTQAARRAQLAGMLLLFIDAAQLIGDLESPNPNVDIAVYPSIEDEYRIANQRPLATQQLGTETQSLLSHPYRVEIPLQTAGLALRLSVGGVVRVGFQSTLFAMFLSGLFCLTGLYGLQVKRRAYLDEKASFDRARLAQVTLHSIGEAVVRLDSNGRIQYMNPIAERMSGIAANEGLGKPLEEVISLQVDGPVTGKDVARILGGHSRTTLIGAYGTQRDVACTLSPVEAGDGSQSGHVLVVRDVSREQELSRELRYQASHDPLTDLPNRREFERRLSRAIEDARNGDRVHSVCYLDLDQFKVVNDTVGHAEGDRLLRQIAGVLVNQVRAGDTIARLGGDEFGILLLDCTLEHAQHAAEKYCLAVSEHRFISDGRAFELGASIGVTTIDSDCGTIGDVQRAADLACYAAKDTGRNRVHLYRQEDHIISRNQRDMLWHVEIKDALETNRFLLYGQPILALHSNTRTKGMREMLIRMIGRDGELVPPMAFIPAAERYGLMKAIDRYTIEHSLKVAATQLGDGTIFNVNLSGQSLADSELEEFISTEALRVGVDPRWVCFEITETAAISNLALATQLILNLRRRGFRFALDDFGAGLSSFGYLKQLPVDFLKIDGQFVRDINIDPVARAMVESIINVAKVLNIETVAEKVENDEIQRCLQSMGVDYAQGFHVGVPSANHEPAAIVRIA